jgi:multidrug efflux pump subunit AcrB
MTTGPAWLRHPQVTLVCTILLFAAGAWALLTMPRREDPKITVRVGVMMLLYPGATSEQVEQQVTKVIEQRLFRYEEVRKSKTYSTSRPGFAFLNIELEESVQRPDQFWSKLRHDMLELRQTSLPPGVLGPTVDTDFGDTIAVLFALHGGNYEYRQLKDYSERIEESLRTVRATSKVKRYGEQKEQIYITSTPERLAQYRVPLPKVIQALQARNAVQFGGRFETEESKLPIQPNGLFDTPEQISRVMIDVSPEGQPLYLGDVAKIERRYQDPQFLTRYNGQPAMMISVDMREGYNVVEFGQQVSEKLLSVQRLLPPDLKVDLVANQPRMVKERISSFMREFGIAIVAVILVTMLLLPFRVALVAAVAIPVTVSTTFALLNLCGIDLQQVSISMLVVMLGILVDDAIVVADNYVDLLDRGKSLDFAAAHCAREIVVPLVVATLTIIAAFLPTLFTLTGSVGEFIHSMPIVVAISLSVSFAVAFFITPLICRKFIHHGLHTQQTNEKPKFSFVDRLEARYEKLAGAALEVPRLMVVVGVLAVVAGGVLMRYLPQRFFPPAEREQFVIDLWLPEGSKVEYTDALLRKVEKELSANSLIASYGTFVGSSAPRFYYNVDPQQPAGNYGQILVNTRDVDKTPELVYHMRKRLREVVPEALTIVKELQQGEIFSAPIEVRISGEDLIQLKALSTRVDSILRGIPGTEYVHRDWREDPYELKVNLDNEVANRLGFSNASVGRSLAAGFDGVVVSTFWEGSRAVDILLRLDESSRHSFDDVRDAYLTSPVTGAKVPLRQLATLSPSWETGRIVRRNGVRTLTVRSFFQEGFYASNILKQARQLIAQIPLPPGYSIVYGGESESQSNMTGGIVKAALISTLFIFLILLFQFHSVTETLVVMSSIPLSLFGGAVGLLIVGMPFSFVAEIGFIGVGGVVVRNSILLVDSIKACRARGDSLIDAARSAGSRRMRPIFLTTLAAAVGVLPMILSGSLMWAPMAAVIAFGLLFSMFFTLLVVPSLYVLTARKTADVEGGVE